MPKNHSLSRTIGPPNDGLTSHSFWIEFGGGQPLACTPREVVALERAARAAHEEAPGEPVAALLADDVHLRAAGGRLAKPAAQAEHHFLRVADLGHVARHAHALVAAVHAVDEDLSLVPAPAVDLEHAVERGVGALEVVGLHVDRRNRAA